MKYLILYSLSLLILLSCSKQDDKTSTTPIVVSTPSSDKPTTNIKSSDSQTANVKTSDTQTSNDSFVDSIDLYPLISAVVPKTGGPEGYGDQISGRDAVEQTSRIYEQGMEPFPEFYLLGDSVNADTYGHNSGWTGYELFRLLADSSRFNFNTVGNAPNWGVENILNDVENIAELIKYGLSPLNACEKVVMIHETPYTMTLSDATVSKIINIPFLNGSGFTPQTYQFQRTMTITELKLSIQIAWSHTDHLWKIIAREKTEPSDYSFMSILFDMTSGNLNLERITRAQKNSFHSRLQLIGNTKSHNFVIKYIKRTENTKMNISSAFATEITGNADRNSDQTHQIARVRNMFKSSKASIDSAPISFVCLKTDSKDTYYKSWYTAERAPTADGVPGNEETGDNLNYSNYTQISGIQYIMYSEQLVTIRDDQQIFGASSFCTNEDLTSINNISGFKDADLPIDGHPNEGTANWAGKLF